MLLTWASAEIFPGQNLGKVEILLIFFRLLAMQHKWTYTKKKKALVFCSEHGYFKTVLAEFQMNHKKS